MGKFIDAYVLDNFGLYKPVGFIHTGQIKGVELVAVNRFVLIFLDPPSPGYNQVFIRRKSFDKLQSEVLKNQFI